MLLRPTLGNPTDRSPHQDHAGPWSLVERPQFGQNIPDPTRKKVDYHTEFLLETDGKLKLCNVR